MPVALGACVPEPDDSPAPILPPPHAPVVAPPEGAEQTVRANGDANAMMLTTFEPTSGEIYCSFHRPSQDGVLGERLFMTEIAGVPAPGAIGLEGQAVRLTQVSKTESAGAEVWTYRNADYPVEVELRLSETDEGFEFRTYTGTIRITDPVDANAIRIEGDCGV
ncbi:MAG: hypothetical protein ACK46Q_01290 [Hyphomonas sp.]